MLNEADLKELGVERLGERKQMMQQINALKRRGIVHKTQRVGISLASLATVIGVSYVIAMLAALTTALQCSLIVSVLEQEGMWSEEGRRWGLEAGFTMAAGLLASFLLAPVLSRMMKERTVDPSVLQKETQPRVAAAIIGGLIALIKLGYSENPPVENPLLYIGAMFICMPVFPLYGFFQWVLYRAHTLTIQKLSTLAGVTGCLMAFVPIIFLGLFFNLKPRPEDILFGCIMTTFIGAVGFGLSFFLARQLRLYA